MFSCCFVRLKHLNYFILFIHKTRLFHSVHYMLLWNKAPMGVFSHVQQTSLELSNGLIVASTVVNLLAFIKPQEAVGLSC